MGRSAVRILVPRHARVSPAGHRRSKTAQRRAPALKRHAGYLTFARRRGSRTAERVARTARRSSPAGPPRSRSVIHSRAGIACTPFVPRRRKSCAGKDLVRPRAPIPPDEVALAKHEHVAQQGVAPWQNACRAGRARRRSSSPRRRSIAFPFPCLDDCVREHPVAEDLFRASGEVGHLDKGLISVGRNNASNQPISLTQFNCLAGAQPGFQTAGVAQLADIHGWHRSKCATKCGT